LWRKTQPKYEENLNAIMKSLWNIHGLLDGLSIQLTIIFESNSKMNMTLIKSLPHVCDVAGENIPPHILSIYLENTGRQGILIFYQWKNEMWVAT